MNKIGRYDVISELGRGAMGIVYRASDPTIGREVALKVLSLSASSEGGTHSPQEMFMREVRAAGRLAHPSIVTIHDAFEDPENQTCCIVMEMVPGVTLEKILESDPPPTTEEALDLVRQVTEGLDYAHRNQVIHRDLKPANILVTMDGHAKITDFGIAKVLAREGVARTVGVMGTPSYMSPEQVRGGDIDARTDIFSLGIIAFTMLAGRKPFLGNTAAVMFKIVYEEPPAPSSLNPQLTGAHDYLIKKCLAKDRNLRYSSARELLDDLDDLQQGRALRSRTAAPASALAPSAPAAAPPQDHTLAMPVPSPMRTAPPPPAPRPAPSTAPSAPPPQKEAAPPKPVTPPKPAPPPVAPVGAGGTITPPAAGGTLAMPIPGIMKGAQQPPPPRVVSAPPASPSVPVQQAKPAMPPPVTPSPDSKALPLAGQTLAMRVPDLSAVGPSVRPSPPTAPMPPAFDEPMPMERTIPTPPTNVPVASSPAPSSPRVAPAPPAPPASPQMERTRPMPPPEIPAAPPTAKPRPAAPTPPLLSDAPLEVLPEGASGEVAPAPKSKLMPVMVGGVAVVLLAAATWGYWKFRQTRIAPAPPPQVAVQAPPETPPPTPAETPTPAPAGATEQQTPPESAAPVVVKKPIVRKTKQAPAPIVPTPEPTPPPVQPQPPPPAPKLAPPTPSPEEIAKAEAARLAKIPRIIQVVCNYGLKEATFVFSASGKPLFEETLKGKKIKGGFLGIKGSHQGSFTHTITVPAGTSQVTVRVISKEGEADRSKDITMPPPGGFVPTLAVDVDNEHMNLNWKGSSTAK